MASRRTTSPKTTSNLKPARSRRSRKPTRASGSSAGTPSAVPVLPAIPALGKTLPEWKKDAQAWRPPRVVIPGIAMEGRLTFMPGREKSGKSTLTCFFAAVLTKGTGVWGGPKRAHRVAYVGLEEATEDALLRLDSLAPRGELLHFTPRLAGAGDIESLKAEVRQHRATVLIIDSWAAWTRTLINSENDARANTVMCQALADWAHEDKLCIIVLHHMNKEGEARGSTAITAAADIICSMEDVSGAPTQRLLTSRGRIPATQLLLDWDPKTNIWTRLEGSAPAKRQSRGLTDQEIEARILALLEATEAMSAEALRAGVSAKGVRVTAALKRLLAQGRVELLPARKGYRLAQPRAAS